MTASLYVRTPMKSKPTRLATSVNTAMACSSQRLLEDKGESQAAPLPWEELSAGSEGTGVIGSAVLGVGGSRVRVGGEMLESWWERASLGVGDEHSDGEVALLPRD